jgi:hypothetical protein
MQQEHNSRQEPQLSNSVAHAAGRLCAIPMCYFGLVHLRLQLAVMTCCTNPVHTATNTTACRELSKSSSTTCCRMSVPIPMCYFGLAYSAACSWLY